MRSHGACDPNPIGSMALVTVLYMGLNRAVTRCTYIGRNVRIIHRSSKERGTLQFVADIVSSYYIRDVGFLKKCFEKVCFLLRRMETRNERQASVHHVFVPALLATSLVCRHKFRKAERGHVDLITAAAKFGYNILGKKSGVASGNVQVNVFHSGQAVQDRFKLCQKLNFVQKDVIHRAVFYLFFHKGIQHLRGTISGIFEGIKAPSFELLKLFAVSHLKLV